MKPYPSPGLPSSTTGSSFGPPAGSPVLQPDVNQTECHSRDLEPYSDAPFLRLFESFVPRRFPNLRSE